MSNGQTVPEGHARRRQDRLRHLIKMWPSFVSEEGLPRSAATPTSLLFANGQMITMAFVPATATVPKPPASAITALITRRPDRATHHLHHGTDHLAQHAVAATTTPATTPPSTTRHHRAAHGGNQHE